MIYFLSDVHLGFYERQKDKPREDLLLSWLRKISDNCEHLIILGDLFDFWFEYKTVIPKYFYRTLAELKNLRDRNIFIEFLIGNHDFSHIDFFEKELDIRVFPDDIEREFCGKRFYISHGDGKTKFDGPYLFLKSILRNKTAQKLYSMFHPDCGIGLASHSSQKSRNYTDNKNYGEIEGMEEFAQKKLNEGFDYVIMGHRHKIIMKQLGIGWYVNPGTWLKQPAVVQFDGEKVEIIYINKFLGIE
jgi:UDP-2,3-diacylglucosamine hydrolase